MKKVGDILTLRGSAPINTKDFRINLADGTFDSGFKILSFDISAPQPVATYEIQGKLLTMETASFTGAYWYWADNAEIAWAVWGAPSSNQLNYTTFTDEENMVIEDLYIQIYTTSGDIGDVNYMITLQKYDLTDWEGAYGMVRNRSQS